MSQCHPPVNTSLPGVIGCPLPTAVSQTWRPPLKVVVSQRTSCSVVKGGGLARGGRRELTSCQTRPSTAESRDSRADCRVTAAVGGGKSSASAASSSDPPRAVSSVGGRWMQAEPHLEAGRRPQPHRAAVQTCRNPARPAAGRWSLLAG